MNSSSLLTRLRERKIGQWAIAYLAGSWLVLQVLSLIAQPFAWPTLVLKAAVVLLGVGFLAVLVLAWYHGERGQQKVSGVELLILAALRSPWPCFRSSTPAATRRTSISRTG